MPDPNNPNHADLNGAIVAALATVAAHGSTATGAYAAWYEQNPTPINVEDSPCPELNQGKADALALVAAFDAALQAVPCNVI